MTLYKVPSFDSLEGRHEISPAQLSDSVRYDTLLCTSATGRREEFTGGILGRDVERRFRRLSSGRVDLYVKESSRSVPTTSTESVKSIWGQLSAAGGRI